MEEELEKSNIDTKERITSLEIAKITGKKHKNVLKTIRNLELTCIKANGNEFCLSQYKDKQGKLRPMYIFNKQEVSYLNQRFMNDELAKFCGQQTLICTSRFETSFSNILIPILEKFGLKVERQCTIGDYRIDFYIPKLKIAIEYDEEQHNSFMNILKDKQREEYLKNVLKCKFIRVPYNNTDAENVGIVLSKILKVK